jgi:RNA polymerase sigma-70 factor (ECF subfamily)
VAGDEPDPVQGVGKAARQIDLPGGVSQERFGPREISVRGSYSMTEAALMRTGPPTEKSLLVPILDSSDAEAWHRFVEIYGPLVYDYGRRHGLQDADAADLTQDVLRAVAGTAGRFVYDPGRGSFRSWRFTVARTKRLDLKARSARQPRGSADPMVAGRLDALPDRGGEAEEDEWRLGYRRRLFEWASERGRGEFQPSTWQAFRRTALGGERAADVARDLGLSPGAVYMARNRILARLREEIEPVRLDEDEL